jgi:hypothetical protein
VRADPKDSRNGEVISLGDQTHASEVMPKGVFEIAVRSKTNPFAGIVENYRKAPEDLAANESGDLKACISIQAALASEHAVYTIVGELKGRIALPFDIQVVFEECGDLDSHYDEKTHEIVISGFA